MPLLESEPVDLELDDDGDLLVDTDLHLVSGIDGVVQGVRFRMQLFKGEWFLDLDAGVPYYQDLLGEKFNDAKARKAFRDAILDTPGVLDVVSLVIRFDDATRALTVSWQASTQFGDTVPDTLAVAA